MCAFKSNENTSPVILSANILQHRRQQFIRQAPGSPRSAHPPLPIRFNVIILTFPFVIADFHTKTALTLIDKEMHIWLSSKSVIIGVNVTLRTFSASFLLPNSTPKLLLPPRYRDPYTAIVKIGNYM